MYIVTVPYVTAVVGNHLPIAHFHQKGCRQQTESTYSMPAQNMGKARNRA
ncbi:hypothetical protein HMPREF0293_0834 [Corynebacterium glucuronolyticum ATCC 51866]|uniref:Uncharacterized protein n=1 Tax=Corynebacterium glucuronolyticum ATCC 51866 TaxID=548478 RepID=A0ABP2DUL8_9CORY|nr:hypothetical protein HMPREF0293_0834 [Corynebacterium glucuronolyticum ATCC 51866]